MIVTVNNGVITVREDTHVVSGDSVSEVRAEVIDKDLFDNMVTEMRRNIGGEELL